MTDRPDQRALLVHDAAVDGHGAPPGFRSAAGAGRRSRRRRCRRRAPRRRRCRCSPRARGTGPTRCGPAATGTTSSNAPVASSFSMNSSMSSARRPSTTRLTRVSPSFTVGRTDVSITSGGIVASMLVEERGPRERALIDQRVRLARRIDDELQLLLLILRRTSVGALRQLLHLRPVAVDPPSRTPCSAATA